MVRAVPHQSGSDSSIACSFQKLNFSVFFFFNGERAGPELCGPYHIIGFQISCSRVVFFLHFLQMSTGRTPPVRVGPFCIKIRKLQFSDRIKLNAVQGYGSDYSGTGRTNVHNIPFFQNFNPFFCEYLARYHSRCMPRYSLQFITRILSRIERIKSPNFSMFISQQFSCN